MALFAPLCGSIWNLVSSDLKSITNGFLEETTSKGILNPYLKPLTVGKRTAQQAYPAPKALPFPTECGRRKFEKSAF